MDARILDYVFRIWFCEIAVSGVNYFVLMRRVYEPRWGELTAHRIGMTTRIVYIFGFAYALDYFARLEDVGEYLLAGVYWTLMVLAFEWVGSLLIRRPVEPRRARRRPAQRGSRHMAVTVGAPLPTTISPVTSKPWRA